MVNLSDEASNTPCTFSKYLFLINFALSCNILIQAAVLRNKTKNQTSLDMNTNELLMPVSILGSLGAAVYFFAKVMTDYILKKKMIDKGFVNDETQAIFKQHVSSATNKYSSLKWGLITFFAGLSLILMEYIPFDSYSPLPYGLFAVSVSVGFLIYYFLVKQQESKNK
jgi:hypothetical protein